MAHDQATGDRALESRGNPARIATLLGIGIAEGFIAMEAKDSAEVKSIGNSVLNLSRGLAVGEHALRRSRTIIDHAKNAEWLGARDEWDGVLTDLEDGTIEIKSADMAKLVSIAGWMHGTEALSALVLQNYSAARAELLRQPTVVQPLDEQLASIANQRQSPELLAEMLQGIRKIRVIIENNERPLSEKSVLDIYHICETLVRACSHQ